MSLSIIDITIGFRRHTYSVDEANEAVIVRVAVMDVEELSTNVEVNLTIHDNTATSATPEDYTTPSLPIVLVFDGSNLVQNISINITDDNITEYSENFTCILSSVHSAVTLSLSRAIVEIRDNDGETDTLF